MKKSNIIMIGMAGAGKSTTGVVVAKILAKDFLDGDLVIQKKTGRLLQDIINTDGNDGFRRIEEEILCGIDVKNTVIAPGGSAIYYPSVFEHFKKDGIVVFLHVPVEEIERRLSNLATRGVTLEPGQTVADLYYQRLPLYQQFADITIDTTGLCLEETVAEIVKAVNAAE